MLLNFFAHSEGTVHREREAACGPPRLHGKTSLAATRASPGERGSLRGCTCDPSQGKRRASQGDDGANSLVASLQVRRLSPIPSLAW
jgi:hypothetical protein